MSNAEILEQKQKEFHRLQPKALKAQEQIKSLERAILNAETLGKIKSIVELRVMSADEALISIGRIQQIIAAWREPEDIIVEFESVKQSLNHILGTKI